MTAQPFPEAGATPHPTGPMAAGSAALFAAGGAAPENRPTALSHLLADVTPAAVHYRRNHYPYPTVDESTWRLPITGAVSTEIELTIRELRRMPVSTRRVLLECAGHRRTEFQPPISGVQWGLGALSQADWSGVALADVLALAGVRDDAVEVVLHGADRGRFPELDGVHSYSRSIPLTKALDPHTLLALDMNGAALPREHGAPVRAVVPGWYAMDSVKWLTAIEVVTSAFTGPYQELDYRFQPAGETGIGARLDVMPPHALLVSIADGDTLSSGHHEITGIAWAGHGVASVEVRVGAGPWELAKITPGPDRYQRVVWRTVVDVAAGQPTVLAVRCTDDTGTTQPTELVWNRRGYVNNSVQTVRVNVV
ncbi:MAG TPA: sulfite oxidase [Micromonosporaceae bacterium]|nr:sulfite oxidase [Micromonosporaceae bacterium]